MDSVLYGFADTLLSFKDDRKTLIKKIENVYESIGVKLPTLESGELNDIDPFTVYGLFNKGLTDANRKLIIQGLKKEFDVSADIPSDFAGVPVLNNMMATFYRFQGREGRKEEDIPNLWEVFEAALNYSKERNEDNRLRLIKAYNQAKTQFAVRWNLTMALFWIRPFDYLALDSRNRWYIVDWRAMPDDYISFIKPLIKDLPSAEDYLAICDECKTCLESPEVPFDNFPSLSFSAWTVSEEVNEDNKAKTKVDALGDKEGTNIRYWLYSPGDNARLWDECFNQGIMVLGWDEIGDTQDYSTKESLRLKLVDALGGSSSCKNAAHAVWQFSNEIKPGDIVFVKKGMHLIVGKGVVTGDYEYRPERAEYRKVRKVNWTDNGEWPHPGQAAMKTLTDITPYTEYIEKLNNLFEDEPSPVEPETSIDPYGEEDFLAEVYLSEDDYRALVALIQNKKNVILQGAPGVGKTFAARRLAYSIMGEKDKSRVRMVQFHQSYSYEDFIMGFRPTEAGFELKKGAFYNFCKEAEIDSENDYYFIIDEINRGNLSKIFGELFMLIENDKRGVQLQLLYSNEKFSVPENVYIIGMMNTADRSLAMLDYALRRRFAFYEMHPGFEADGFVAYQEGLDSPKFNALIDCVKALNERIASDDSLGEGFCIGHSYFCNLKEASNEALTGIIDYELIPLLKEYWFDEPSKVKEWTDRLKRAIK